MKQITVKIDADGQAIIETTGFKGSACSLATRELEKALGVATSDVKRPEFYQQNTQEQKAGQ